MQTFSREHLPPADAFAHYRKTQLTRMARVDGPFEVVTREGTLTCPDGYLALDNNDDPYPVAIDVAEGIYEMTAHGVP